MSPIPAVISLTATALSTAQSTKKMMLGAKLNTVTFNRFANVSKEAQPSAYVSAYQMSYEDVRSGFLRKALW
jgi:hypothetical protein